METSAAKFLAYLCYSEEEIAEIRARNAVVETAEVTEQSGFAQRDESVPKDTIELVDVTGPTFKGKMLIVHDPARVKVARGAGLFRGGLGRPGGGLRQTGKCRGCHQRRRLHG